MPQKEDIVSWLKSFQAGFIAMLEKFELQGVSFQKNSWQRPGGGGGLSAVLQRGQCFEKAGVNFSEVHGELPDRLVQKLNLKERGFFATGVSIVVHPHSPCVPTVHANFRYFQQPDRSWFGGGADLTPYVYQPEDFRLFHRSLKSAADFYSPEAYSNFKKQCDDYFFIPHREEHRGVGGIFFDYISEAPDHTFAFIQKSATALIQSYSSIVEKNKDRSFSERQKKFQLLRRGRYVEFNLIYDRGTLFGLETKGNIESILMSLPPVVHFDYSPDMEQTEEEKKLTAIFKKASDWV